MKRSRKNSSTLIATDILKFLGIILFCMLFGYTIGRFVEVASIQQVYSVKTPVTYMHGRYKGQSKTSYQSTINADNATINSLVNVFNRDSQKLQEYRDFTHNVSISYENYSDSVSVSRDGTKRVLYFIGRSSDSDVAQRMSRSYAEDAVLIIQKISTDANINVKLNSQKAEVDQSVDRHFGSVFMLFGFALGFGLAINYWSKDSRRRLFYNKMVKNLNGK